MGWLSQASDCSGNLFGCDITRNKCLRGLVQKNETDLAIFELFVPLKRDENSFVRNVVGQFDGQTILFEARNESISLFDGKAGVSRRESNSRDQSKTDSFPV